MYAGQMVYYQRSRFWSAVARHCFGSLELWMTVAIQPSKAVSSHRTPRSDPCGTSQSWQERSMAQLRSKAAHPARNPLIAVASLAILFHFGAVIVHALAAPSGPWPGPDGISMAGPPSFTRALDEPLV